MGVKGRNLVHLRHGDLELFGQRMQVPGGQASLLVLDQVQILDQQRALARPFAEDGLDGGDLPRLQHPAFGEVGALAPPGPRMNCAPAAGSADTACARVIHARERSASTFCLSSEGGIGIPYTKHLWCRAGYGAGGYDAVPGMADDSEPARAHRGSGRRAHIHGSRATTITSGSSGKDGPTTRREVRALDRPVYRTVQLGARRLRSGRRPDPQDHLDQYPSLGRQRGRHRARLPWPAAPPADLGHHTRRRRCRPVAHHLHGGAAIRPRDSRAEASGAACCCFGSPSSCSCRKKRARTASPAPTTSGAR